MFPTLTPDQIARVASHGKIRRVSPGERLIEQGDRDSPFVLVLSGAVELTLSTTMGKEVVIVGTAGSFFGDVTLLSHRPSLVWARMREAGEVVQLDRTELRQLVQGDSELADILVRAFALRRLETIARG